MLIHIKNTIRFFLKQLIIVLALFLPVIAISQDLPEKPNPPRLVNDYTNILLPEEVNRLESKLVAYSDSTSTQIVVLMVNDLLGYDKADYAIRIGEKWGVGQKDSDNGVVILIKPTGKQGERGAFIAVGYGLEPVITDALSKRIIENEMIPNFRENSFYAGLDQATTILMQLASGEFPAGYNKKANPKAFAFLIPFFVIIIVLLMIKKGGNKTYNGGRNTSFWTTLFLLSTMNNSSSGSWGSFSSGGSSGGGFGGFGGGSFGGGGAGGSW